MAQPRDKGGEEVHGQEQGHHQLDRHGHEEGGDDDGDGGGDDNDEVDVDVDVDDDDLVSQVLQKRTAGGWGCYELCHVLRDCL